MSTPQTEQWRPSHDFLRVLRPEAEAGHDVAVDAEALLVDVAGHGEGRARGEEEDQGEEMLKPWQECGQQSRYPQSRNIDYRPPMQCEQSREPLTFSLMARRRLDSDPLRRP